VRLVVNGAAVAGTSLGGKRYYNGIVSRLDWPDGIRVRDLLGPQSLVRLREFAYRGRRDEIFWSPNQRGPLLAPNHVVTVLDCINVEYVYRDDWRLPAYRRLFNLILDNASAVVAISCATRDSILRNYRIDRDKVVVIAGPNDFRGDLGRSPHSHATKTTSATRQPFVLLFSNLLPHKNTERAATAFAASSAARRGIALRVVGPLASRAIEACRAAGVTVEQHVGVDDATLQGWLQDCVFMLSPSLAEGLNLPIGEALSLGANVLCSDIPVHREFFDDQVRFFDPTDIAAIAHALDLAFEAPGSWVRQTASSYRRTFDHVTLEYTALFQRVARAGSSGGP